MTHRDEDKRVLRNTDAAKGATVIFWRLAGGAEEELLALRVLLLDFDSICVDRRIVIVKAYEWPVKAGRPGMSGLEL